MISELFVPRPRLADFLRQAAKTLRRLRASVIYGTVRLIERDEETFLRWAREAGACTVMNLHVEHTPAGVEAAAEASRALIDHARDRGGSYFLTYHRWATRDQVVACHPWMPEFLAMKRRYDPRELFQSDWYRHHMRLLGA
jgi:FAD/FMN-containing dehydrogenase